MTTSEEWEDKAACSETFLRAARAVAEHHSEVPVPAMYLLRHAFELAQKAFISGKPYLFKGTPQPYGEWFEVGHNLILAWKKIKDELSKWVSPEKFKQAHDAMKKLHGLDPRGNSFRYEPVPHKNSIRSGPLPILVSPPVVERKTFDQIAAAVETLEVGYNAVWHDSMKKAG